MDGGRLLCCQKEIHNILMFHGRDPCNIVFRHYFQFLYKYSLEISYVYHVKVLIFKVGAQSAAHH